MAAACSRDLAGAPHQCAIQADSRLMLLLLCIVAAVAPACGVVLSSSAGGPWQQQDSVSVMCSSRAAFRHGQGRTATCLCAGSAGMLSQPLSSAGKWSTCSTGGMCLLGVPCRRARRRGPATAAQCSSTQLAGCANATGGTTSAEAGSGGSDARGGSSGGGGGEHVQASLPLNRG